MDSYHILEHQYIFVFCGKAYTVHQFRIASIL